MPDIIDADVDEDDGGLLGEDIFFEAFLEVGDLVAADAGAEDLDAEVGVLFLDAVLDHRRHTP